MSLAISLLLGFGCTGPYSDIRVSYPERDGNEFKRINIVPGAVRTICIQPDPAQPEMALIVKPLEDKLAAKGYKIMATPDEAVHTMRLHLNVFGTERKPVSQNAPLVSAAVIGNAAATPSIGTTAGAAGGLGGLVLATILSAGSKPKGPLFYAEVDVRISDPAAGQQHTVQKATWQFYKDPRDPAVMKDMKPLVAEDLANKVAPLMP